MPKKARELSAVEVKRLTKPGLHAVGGVAGLMLQVAATGARSWIFRTTVGGRRREIGLGGFPDVTLAGARDKARDTKEAIQQGRDPVEERKAARIELIRARARSITFREAAEQCHAVKAHEFRNPKHAAQWLKTLENHAFPVLGDLPVADIETDEVLAALNKIWVSKPETANRVRQRIENVFDHAIASHQRTAANPARLKGCLQPLLPRTDKIKKKAGARHHPALPIAEIPRFMAALRQQKGIAAKALEFVILTAARPSEVIGSKVDKKPPATWAEIDAKGECWEVPQERMKAGKPHRVPLSPEAVAALETTPRFEGSEVVFPSPNGGQMSNATLGRAIQRAHDKDVKAGGKGFLDPKLGKVATPHGFRSTFKDWSLQGGRYPDEWSELALAHVNSDETRAAYARGELIDERRGMMEDWAKYCGGEK